MRNNDISDAELAVMVDIAQNSPITMTANKRANLDHLLEKNFIEPRTQGDELGSGAFALTGKGERKLADLGVGANES